MRNGIAIIISLLMPISVFADPGVDTIYTQDGSILKGTILKQSSNRYQLKINDQSTIDIATKDIIKIEQVNFPNRSTDSTLSKLAPIKRKPKPIYHHSLSIGNLWHSLRYKHPDNPDLENIERYRGVKLTYQKNHTRFVANRNALEFASLKEIEVESSNDQIIASDDDVPSSNYTGLSSTVTVNLNLSKGPQLYLGAGLYIHHYQNEIGGDDTYIGSRFEMGGGWVWDRTSLLLQYQWQGSEMYPDDITSVFSGGLELGMVF